jgi:hypothetical protein
VKELFKFQNTESKIQPNHGPSPMVVPPRYIYIFIFYAYDYCLHVFVSLNVVGGVTGWAG